MTDSWRQARHWIVSPSTGVILIGRNGKSMRSKVKEANDRGTDSSGKRSTRVPVLAAIPGRLRARMP